MQKALLVIFVLTGCSPVASFRPASGLMNDRDLEVGVGAAAVSPRPYVEEPWQGVGQFWVMGEPTRFLALSAIGAFDDEAFALGGAARLNYLRLDRFVAGAEGEAGLLWAAVSLPFAVRVFDQSFVYSAPRLGTWSSDALVSLPLGTSVRIYDGFMLRAEGQVTWQGFHYYNRRVVVGGAAAYQF